MILGLINSFNTSMYGDTPSSLFHSHHFLQTRPIIFCINDLAFFKAKFNFN